MVKRGARANRVDTNQNAIVAELNRIPGVSVEVDHDDILVGFRGLTLWYEIKSPDVTNKAGEVFESKITTSEKKRRNTWAGHYRIVSTLDEILGDMGLLPPGRPQAGQSEKRT